MPFLPVEAAAFAVTGKDAAGGACESDIEEAALFFQRRIAVICSHSQRRSPERQKPFFQAGQKDRPEFQPLGGMERHQLDVFRLAAHKIPILQKRNALQKWWPAPALLPEAAHLLPGAAGKKGRIHAGVLRKPDGKIGGWRQSTLVARERRKTARFP